MSDNGSIQLVRYDAMCQAIDRAFDVDEVKEIHDKAVALEAYFRQAKNPEPERRACEIRLRAERKAGKLLKVMEKHPPGPSGDRSNNATDLPPRLADLGISKDQSSRWQQLADVPDEDFEAALAAPEKPSTNGIIKKPKQEPMNPNALWFWHQLRDFEDQLLGEDPKVLVSQMLQGMQEDVLRLAPIVAEWLKGVNRNV